MRNAARPQEERNAIREELAAADAARDSAREAMKSLRERLRFTRLDAIDAEIASIEHAIAHTSMPLNEEKKLLSQIKELTRSRDDVRLLQEHQQKINEGEARAQFSAIAPRSAGIHNILAL